MAATRKTGGLWAPVVGGGVLAVGIFMIAAAWWKGPLPRETLSPIEQIGPIVVETPLVRYGGLGPRQSSGTYRTQDIRLYSAGPLSGTYRPAPTLWVADLDRVSRGQKLRFLVDPRKRLVYEAISDGRVLLSFEATAAELRSTTRQDMLLGLAFAGIGIFQLAPILWRRWNRAQQNHQPT